MHQLLVRGTVAAAPPSLVEMPPTGLSGNRRPWRYLYVRLLTAGLLVVTIRRPGFPDEDIGNNAVLDLGCTSAWLQEITFLGGPGTVEVHIVDNLDEANLLASVR